MTDRHESSSPGLSPAADAPAVILVNLGTPSEPTPRAVRVYLREFLSDRRVIEMSPLLWRPILEGIVLRVRPRASAKKYASVWTEAGSPLMRYSLAQRDALAASLDGRARVYLAMRYGQPAVGDVLDAVYRAGHRRVLVVPLYPQFAASSAGTVVDEVSRWSLRARDQFELRTIRSFPTDPGYIEAVAGAVEEAWAERGRPHFAQGDRLVLSFHSIPTAMHEAGDPYLGECHATARALRARLGLDEKEAPLTLQSVFGPSEWLKPATIDTMGELARSGTRRVDVVCPGFAADCLETLEEIDILNREHFLAEGGSEFHYLPWGNDRPRWTEALTRIVTRHLAGWVEPVPAAGSGDEAAPVSG